MEILRPPLYAADVEAVALGPAFRWVLACHEIAHGIDPSRRLGLIPKDLVPIRGAPVIEATGPRFSREFSTLSAPIRRHPGQAAAGRIMPPIPAMVPAVPDKDNLVVLLDDNEHDLPATSTAERLICEAHKWLRSALRIGQIRSWADASIGPPESEDCDVAPIGRCEVLPEIWEWCDVDYRAAEAVSRHDDWEEIARDGYRHRGFLILERVAIDRTQLMRLLRTDFGAADPWAPGPVAPPQKIPAALKMLVASDEEEVWVLTWRGTDCRIAIDGSPMLSRGMRAIALLLRHDNIPISYYLLEGLNRRPGHGRNGKGDKSSELVAFQEIADPLGRNVFDEIMKIEEAHAALSQALQGKKGLIGNGFLAAATWSPSFKPPSRLSRGVTWPDGKRCGENLRESVSEALKAITGSDSAAGPEAAAALSKVIIPDGYSYRYDSPSDPASWQVETIKRGPWTRR